MGRLRRRVASGESKERLLRNRLAAAGYSETIPMAFSDEATEPDSGRM